jgi:putative acetyltransferase
MREIHEESARLQLPGLTSNISRTAPLFFARSGFEIVEHRSPEIRGVTVPNALKRKALKSN